jgi:hypothetical protein
MSAPLATVGDSTRAPSGSGAKVIRSLLPTWRCLWLNLATKLYFPCTHFVFSSGEAYSQVMQLVHGPAFFFFFLVERSFLLMGRDSCAWRVSCRGAAFLQNLHVRLPPRPQRPPSSTTAMTSMGVSLRWSGRGAARGGPMMEGSNLGLMGLYQDSGGVFYF